MVHAWDNYPIAQFPRLWEWVQSEVGRGHFTMSNIALEETEHKHPDCALWLKQNHIVKLPETQPVLLEALRLQLLLGIKDFPTTPKGVDENDLLIIATAKIFDQILITNEARQPTLPDNLVNCKIPAVCGMRTVSVPCLNFLDLIKRSQSIFA